MRCASDQTLKVWNLQTGEEEKTLAGHQGEIFSVAVISGERDEGRKAISASSDHSIKIWDVATGRELASIVLDGAMVRMAVHEAPSTSSGSETITVVAGDQGGGVYCLNYIEPTTTDSGK